MRGVFNRDFWVALFWVVLMLAAVVFVVGIVVAFFLMSRMKE